jgi:hypothetical protein
MSGRACQVALALHPADVPLLSELGRAEAAQAEAAEDLANTDRRNFDNLQAAAAARAAAGWPEVAALAAAEQGRDSGGFAVMPVAQRAASPSRIETSSAGSPVPSPQSPQSSPAADVGGDGFSVVAWLRAMQLPMYCDAVRARPWHLSARSVFRSKSSLYGSFAWAWRALNGPKRR